jgi:hypothetical protein
MYRLRNDAPHGNRRTETTKNVVSGPILTQKSDVFPHSIFEGNSQRAQTNGLPQIYSTWIRHRKTLSHDIALPAGSFLSKRKKQNAPYNGKNITISLQLIKKIRIPITRLDY